jgi:hypothetical protein
MSQSELSSRFWETALRFGLAFSALSNLNACTKPPNPTNYIEAPPVTPEFAFSQEYIKLLQQATFMLGVATPQGIKPKCTGWLAHKDNLSAYIVTNLHCIPPLNPQELFIFDTNNNIINQPNQRSQIAIHSNYQQAKTLSEQIASDIAVIQVSLTPELDKITPLPYLPTSYQQLNLASQALTLAYPISYRQPNPPGSAFSYNQQPFVDSGDIILMKIDDSQIISTFTPHNHP